MPFIVWKDCPCCRTMSQRGSAYHCENCWDNYHNGRRDKDWLNKEEYDKKHGKLEQELKRLKK